MNTWLINGFVKQDVKVAPVVVEEKKVPEPVQQLKQEPKQLPKEENEVQWHLVLLFKSYF